MTNRSFGQGVRWSSRMLLGLLLAFAFLGHDLLMAGDAHHATAAVSHGAGHHNPEPAHFEGIVADAVGLRAGTMAEHDGCGSFVLAAPASNNQGATSGRHHAILAVVAMDRATAPAPAETAEPTAPPGVRRALLQVFLI